jgi:hypothetical protein
MPADLQQLGGVLMNYPSTRRESLERADVACRPSSADDGNGARLDRPNLETLGEGGDQQALQQRGFAVEGSFSPTYRLTMNRRPPPQFPVAVHPLL